MDRQSLIQKFKEILQLETDRNELLKDSGWAAFAISDSIVFEHAVDSFMAFLNVAIIKESNAGWMR